jgi:hypothetical protein
MNYAEADALKKVATKLRMAARVTRLLPLKAFEGVPLRQLEVVEQHWRPKLDELAAELDELAQGCHTRRRA